MQKTPELSVVIPCLNEAATIAKAISLAKELIADSGLTGEVVVSDNGSDDGSQRISEEAGARVVTADRRGYGFALLSGIRAAAGNIIVMGDADATYDFREAIELVQAVRQGADLAMGSRLRGNIAPGAMPTLHRYLGTPVLTTLIRLFFGLRISDCNCGMRAFSKEAFNKMGLVSGGMEFASEMLIKAAINDLKVVEFPCSLHPDTRDRKPHLNTWRDGWRHLRFILLFAPHIIFTAPGWILSAFFGMFILLLSLGPVSVGNTRLDYHHLFYAVPVFCIGIQLLWFSAFANRFRKFAGLDTSESDTIKKFHLERWLGIGFLIGIAGFTLFASVLIRWLASGQGALLAIRPAVMALTLVLCGFLTIMNAIMLSMLELHTDSRTFLGK
jgi:glycosyltransferase involved in cell wall biosynthesis